MYSILVIDDEKWIRKGIIAKLNYREFKFKSIFEAENGQDALNIVKTQHPQIIISDVRMPKMDGIQLLREVGAFYKDIKFIFISGYAEFDYVQKAVSLGAKDYILKPIVDEELKSTLIKVINELDNEMSIKIAAKKDKEIKEANEIFKLEYVLNEVFYDNNMKNLSIPIDELYKNDLNSKFVVAILHLHNKQDEIDENNNNEGYFKTFKNSIFEMLPSINNKCDLNVLIFNNLRNSKEIFIIIIGNDVTLLKVNSVDYISKVYNIISEKVYNNFTIGLSDVAEEISKKLYDEAKCALELRLIYGNKRVYKYKDFVTNEKNFFIYPEDKLKILSKCIQVGDLKNINILLNDLFITRALNEKSCEYISMLYSECVNLLVKICNEEEIHINNVMQHEMITGEKVCNYNNCEDIVKDFCNTIKYIMGQRTNCSFFNNLSVVDKTEKYIKQHYSEELTVNELSQKFLINPTYYSNLFSKEVGLTLSKYITKVRIKNACKLLEGTSIGISDISFNVGYQDLQYFYRVFKKEMKLTPAEYRNSINKEEDTILKLV